MNTNEQSVLTQKQQLVLGLLYMGCTHKATDYIRTLDSRLALILFHGIDDSSLTHSKVLQDRFDELINRLDIAIQAFRALKPEDRPVVAYKLLDDYLKDIPYNISCKKGCAECCRMRVHTTKSEAKLIYSYATSRKIPINWDHVEAQKNKKINEYSTHLMGEKNKCPLLTEDNTCSVYEVRPYVCRSYHVITPPEWCNQDLSRPDIKNILCSDSPQANIIYSAYCFVEGNKDRSLSCWLSDFKE